jgi:hypothetical protein
MQLTAFQSKTIFDWLNHCDRKPLTPTQNHFAAIFLVSANHQNRQHGYLHDYSVNTGKATPSYPQQLNLARTNR